MNQSVTNHLIKMSGSEQSHLCQSEREVVNAFLKNNSVGFANLLKERL